jgi:hypothetical protein
LEKLGIPSFSWEFPIIFHRGIFIQALNAVKHKAKFEYSYSNDKDKYKEKLGEVCNIID